MAKASRVAARTQKKLVSVDERLTRIELMLEAMMTAKQRERFDTLLADLEADEGEDDAIEALRQQAHDKQEARNGRA